MGFFFGYSTAMTNSISIQPYNHDTDLRGDITVYVKTWQDTYSHIMPVDFLNTLDVDALHERFKKNPPIICNQNSNDVAFVFLVAKNGDEVIGHVKGPLGHQKGFDGFDSFLMALYVLPEYQRDGIGLKLFEAFKQEVQKRGAKNMYCGCLKENTKGRKFYEKNNGILMDKEGTFKRGEIRLPEVYFSWEL